MAEESATRKLAAIFYADVVGYSRLTGDDESSAHHAVMEVLDFTRDAIVAQGGAVLRFAGDAILAEFASVVACANAAISVQTELAKRNENVEAARQVRLRIGVNLGEVLEDRGEIYGEGANVAARLEALAAPGGVCISAQAAEQIDGKVDACFESAGLHKLKNIARPVEIWCWPAGHASQLRRLTRPRRFVAVLGTLAVAAIVALTYMFVVRESGDTVSVGSKIAVIPFEELNSNGGDGYFSDGLTKDVNTYLSRFTNLFVFAPSAVREFRSGVDCAKVRDVLGADFILEGTVRLAGEKMRISTTLTDATTCRQLDSPGPYDRNLGVTDVLDVQLEIATKVAAALGSSDAPLFTPVFSVPSATRRRRGSSPTTASCSRTGSMRTSSLIDIVGRGRASNRRSKKIPITRLVGHDWRSVT